LHVARTAFEENLIKKLGDQQFRSDITGLLRPSISWDIDEAARFVIENLLVKIP
jgi:hypothetical protein